MVGCFSTTTGVLALFQGWAEREAARTRMRPQRVFLSVGKPSPGRYKAFIRRFISEVARSNLVEGGQQAGSKSKAPMNGHCSDMQ